MKKIMLALLLIISLNSFSQYTTYKNVIGYWNESTEAWVYDDYEYAKITFKIKGSYLYADDNAKSKYLLIGNGVKEDNEDNKNIFWRNATDEVGRKCVVSFVYYKRDDYSMIMVMYTDIVFKYFVAKSGGLSNF
jgi:hypothetical protein